MTIYNGHTYKWYSLQVCSQGIFFKGRLLKILYWRCSKKYIRFERMPRCLSVKYIFFLKKYSTAIQVLKVRGWEHLKSLEISQMSLFELVLRRIKT